MNKRGFTLIEVLVTVAILAILSGIAVPRLYDTIATMRLRSTAQLMHSRMRLVQQLATAESKTWRVLFMPEHGQLRFYRDPDYTYDVQPYRVTLPAGAYPEPASGTTEFHFSTQGLINTNHNITLKTASDKRMYIIWIQAGRIRLSDTAP